MGKKSTTIIVYPYLNDCKGDLERSWYVEWRYQIPNEPAMRREREYKGLNKGTAEQRYRLAQNIILEKTDWLKSSDYLRDSNLMPVRENQLTYRAEARLYGSVKQGLPTMIRNINDYLDSIRNETGDSMYHTLQGKLRLFAAWIETNRMQFWHVQHFERAHIVAFVVWAAETHRLSKITVKHYINALRRYFDFEIERGTINETPVKRIPNTGKVVDESAMPFTDSERRALKEAIEPENPQLWLMCQIMFYSAIRPGTEIRLMRVGDIDLERKQIRIPAYTAKNRTTEIVDIPDVLCVELAKWKLEQYPENFYLLGKEGAPSARSWGKNHFRYQYNKYRERLGIPENRKFYSWKHTGAIELIQNGLQPYDLMEHLRHKKFNTTEQYLRKRIKNKNRRVNQFVVAI